MTSSFIVAHPETQHSYQSALALFEARLLDLYITGLSLRRSPWLTPLLERTSPEMLRKLRQHRHHQLLPRDCIRTWPFAALSPALDERQQFRLQAAFSHMVGRTAARRGSGVFCFNTNALQAFRIASENGLPTILDQSIAHRRFSVREGEREAAAFPDWGEHWTAPSWRIDAEDKELALSELVVCGSGFCADTLVEFGVDRARTVVVPYGTDTGRFRPAALHNDDGMLRILFVGQLSLRKGVHYLLEAVRRLGSSRVRVTLVGHRAVNASTLARYADFAEVRPFVLHEEVPALFQEHDLYVFPSLVEGSSISVYEALASGLPVITTPNSGSIVVHERSGLVVPPRDVDGIAAAIERLASDLRERREMGVQARLLAERKGDWRHYRSRLARALGCFAAARQRAS